MFVWDCIAEVVIIECLLLARDLPIVLRVFSHFEACICACMFTRAKQPTHFERALVGGSSVDTAADHNGVRSEQTRALRSHSARHWHHRSLASRRTQCFALAKFLLLETLLLSFHILWQRSVHLDTPTSWMWAALRSASRSAEPSGQQDDFLRNCSQQPC